MKKFLTIITSFTIFFTNILPISCINKNYHINNTDQIISNHIDFDCEEEVNLQNKVEGNFNEHYPKNIDYDFYKVDKCIMQNFIKASQEANEDFEQFTNNYLVKYQNFDQINEMLKVFKRDYGF